MHLDLEDLALHAAHRGLRLVPASGMTQPQRELLELLMEQAGTGITARALCDLDGERSENGLQSALRVLMERGLVQRREGARRTRRGRPPFLYRLTSAGLELAGRSAEGTL